MRLDSTPIFSASDVVVDIEASGLGEDSYPIQIGWAALDQSAIGEFLISPHSSWEAWDELAEGVHGIDRADLAGGMSVCEAAEKLCRELSGTTLYCDAPGFDQYWLERLFLAAGYTSCPFTVRHIREGVSLQHRQELARALEEVPRSHNATEDARLIAAVAGRPCFNG